MKSIESTFGNKIWEVIARIGTDTETESAEYWRWEQRDVLVLGIWNKGSDGIFSLNQQSDCTMDFNILAPILIQWLTVAF